MQTPSTPRGEDELFAALQTRTRLALDAAAALGVAGFVHCELPVVRCALQRIAQDGLARGRVFCEWGSGVGAVAALAASMSYEAYGIEIDAGLVGLARRLADDSGVDVRYAASSFLCVGDDDLAGASVHTHRGTSDDAYRQLGIDPASIDVVFAYPWPGDEHAVDALFLRRASTGALLVTYHGSGYVLVQRHAGDELVTVLRA